MNNKTIEIAITVDLFTMSPTHGAYIHIDSIIGATAFGKLGSFSIALFYSNMKLQNVSCFRTDSGNYLSNILISDIINIC